VSHQLLGCRAILVGVQVLLRGREQRRRWRRDGTARRSWTGTGAAGSTGGTVAEVATALLIGRRSAGTGLRLLLLLGLLLLLRMLLLLLQLSAIKWKCNNTILKLTYTELSMGAYTSSLPLSNQPCVSN